MHTGARPPGPPCRRGPAAASCAHRVSRALGGGDVRSAGVGHRAHGHVSPTHAGRLGDGDVTSGEALSRARSLLPEAEKPAHGPHAARDAGRGVAEPSGRARRPEGGREGPARGWQTQTPSSCHDPAAVGRPRGRAPSLTCVPGQPVPEEPPWLVPAWGRSSSTCHIGGDTEDTHGRRPALCVSRLPSGRGFPKRRSVSNVTQRRGCRFPSPGAPRPQPVGQ